LIDSAVMSHFWSERCPNVRVTKCPFPEGPDPSQKFGQCVFGVKIRAKTKFPNSLVSCNNKSYMPTSRLLYVYGE